MHVNGTLFGGDSQPFVRIHTKRRAANFLWLQLGAKPISNVTILTGEKKNRYNARLDKRPERKHGFDKRCRALWRVLDRGVCHVEEEVAHVDDHGVAKGHVRHVIPPISEPVDGPGLCSARLEPLLEFRRPWRCAKLAHDGLAACIFGGG